MNLTEAANKCVCDKGTTYRERHGYTEIYEGLIRPKCKMLEIGIGLGHSSDMWKIWDPSIEVTYLDIDPGCVESERKKGREAYVCDQSDPVSLQRIIETVGTSMLDVILDDGSHHPNHQVLTLIILWQCLKPGGQFFIEDLHTSVRYPVDMRAHHRIEAFAEQQGADLGFFRTRKLARLVKPLT